MLFIIDKYTDRQTLDLKRILLCENVYELHNVMNIYWVYYIDFTFCVQTHIHMCSSREYLKSIYLV